MSDKAEVYVCVNKMERKKFYYFLSIFLCPSLPDTQYIQMMRTLEYNVSNHQKCVFVYLFSMANVNKSFTFHSYYTHKHIQRILFSFRPKYWEGGGGVARHDGFSGLN